MANSLLPTAVDRKVIVDAGMVIRGERFDRLGKEFFTTENVFREIRDAQARRNLQQLPVELKIREPEQKDFQFVKRFAKETGDLGSLSTNDIGLMALAVSLYNEAGVGDELREKPEVAGVLKQSVPFSWAPSNCDTTSTAEQNNSSRPSTVREFELETYSDDEIDGVHNLEKIDEEKGENNSPSCTTDDVPAAQATTPQKNNNKEDIEQAEEKIVATPQTDTKSVKSENEASGDLENDSVEEKLDKPKILSAAFNYSTVVNDDIENEEDSDNDDGWVTVENIRRLNNVVDRSDEVEEEVIPGSVAIASTDYSVQNVSIQMGLKALSCDGFRIRNVKMWGKICRGCFHSTRETEKIFCPKCGNATLDRVPITLDADGRMIIHDGRRRKTNLRGTVYSIPKYKGGHGRGTKNILLSEDELFIGGRDRQIKYQQKLAEKQKMINDPFQNDVVDGWCTRHITGTGRTVNANPHQAKHGYGRKNPNANNFKSQKFKKK